MAAYGLYTHIRSNRIKTAFVLVIFPFLLPLVVFVVGFCIALPVSNWMPSRAFQPAAAYAVIVAFVAVPLAIIWTPIGYWLSQRIVDSSVGARGISRGEHTRLWNLLENLCISRGLTVPTLSIIDADELNAFASG